MFMCCMVGNRFLGYVDKIGVGYEADVIATGFGAYLALVSHRFCFCLKIYDCITLISGCLKIYDCITFS